MGRFRTEKVLKKPLMRLRKAKQKPPQKKPAEFATLSHLVK